MNTITTKLLTLWLVFIYATTAFSQEKTAHGNTASMLDSLKAVNDSIVESLNNQIQELKLQGIMMQEQLERTNKNAKQDSLRRVARKERVDSLRNVTPGAPLIVEGDTLFLIYARSGGLLPEARAASAEHKIYEVGKHLTMFADSVYVFDSEESSDVMAGEDVIFSVTDLDALWMNTERLTLAEQYRNVISEKVHQLHETYGLQQKLLSVCWVALIIIAMGGLIWGIIWLFRLWNFSLTRKLLRTIKSVSIKNYPLLDAHRLGIAIIFVFNMVRVLLILLVLFIGITSMFSLFPETKTFTYTVVGFIWNPLIDILKSAVTYLPNLFKIGVIIACFHYLLKLVRYFANEIAIGRLKINGFYADWATPTYTILRVLLYSFMFVMIWPLLPNSDSEIFQGVSVFIGVVVSLGSTSVVGNVMAGLVMTYMRPFRIGDYIRYENTEGEVIEKTMLVTRIRTRKNEIMTIPNSNMMSSQTSNFTLSAQRYGVIVHTKITIGYDEPWHKIENLLLEAADRTDGIKKDPKPFVRITTLDDFYVEYEINGCTDRAKTMPVVYSTLHQNILDTMHDAGVEIMSPHIEAQRRDIPVQIPKDKLGD
ncbi:MAG: mechanosensitive ion channel family protein [Bacteroidaceae bacterium]|nr:mechanosensitive ion channel family protein [Bacteroidaceae bacterium]